LKLAHFRLIAARIFLFGCLCVVVAQLASPLLGYQSSLGAQSSKPKPALQSKSQKLKNPLNDLLDEAQRDIENKNFDAAIVPLQKVIADQPEFAYAHFQLAYVYTAVKKTDEARAEYARTIAIDAKMSEAYLNLGTLLLDKQENAAAVAPLRKAVELLPAQSHPRYLLAVALDRLGDRAGATESFEALLHLDPNNITAIDYLGWAALRDGKPGEAEARFRRAVEVQPKESGGCRGLAESLDAQKKPEAAGAYRDYLELMPNDSAARARLIHHLVSQKENDAALAELDRMAAGKQPSFESLKLRADLQIAEKELRIALRLDGKNLAYWKDLSSTFFLGGNYPAALTTLDEIAKMEQPGAGVWFIRAICYDKLNQPKPALEAYQKFLELDQDKNPDQVWQATERSKVLKRMLERKR